MFQVVLDENNAGIKIIFKTCKFKGKYFPLPKFQVLFDFFLVLKHVPLQQIGEFDRGRDGCGNTHVRVTYRNI